MSRARRERRKAKKADARRVFTVGAVRWRIAWRSLSQSTAIRAALDAGADLT